MKKKTRNILLAILAILVVIQFFQIDKTKPESDPAKDFITVENPPQAVAEMLKNTCYDCHSNHTKYPWYTSVQPVAWWIRGHVRGARMQVNYSEWADYNQEDKTHALREMAEVMEEKRMPPKSYVSMHPESKMTAEQEAELLAYFRSKMN